MTTAETPTSGYSYDCVEISTHHSKRTGKEPSRPVKSPKSHLHTHNNVSLITREKKNIKAVNQKLLTGAQFTNFSTEHPLVLQASPPSCRPAVVADILSHRRPRSAKPALPPTEIISWKWAADRAVLTHGHREAAARLTSYGQTQLVDQLRWTWPYWVTAGDEVHVDGES